jgi:hypothetical protein
MAALRFVNDEAVFLESTVMRSSPKERWRRFSLFSGLGSALSAFRGRAALVMAAKSSQRVQ